MFSICVKKLIELSNTSHVIAHERADIVGDKRHIAGRILGNFEDTFEKIPGKPPQNEGILEDIVIDAFRHMCCHHPNDLLFNMRISGSFAPSHEHHEFAAISHHHTHDLLDGNVHDMGIHFGVLLVEKRRKITSGAMIKRIDNGRKDRLFIGKVFIQITDADANLFSNAAGRGSGESGFVKQPLSNPQYFFPDLRL